MTTCDQCEGSGYENHPDSNQVCSKCCGSGNVKEESRFVVCFENKLGVGDDELSTFIHDAISEALIARRINTPENEYKSLGIWSVGKL